MRHKIKDRPSRNWLPGLCEAAEDALSDITFDDVDRMIAELASNEDPFELEVG